MGIWSTIRTALGLARPPSTKAPGPVQLTQGARARIDTLRQDVGVYVQLHPIDGGWRVHVEERSPAPLRHPTLDAPLAIEEDALPRLFGLELHHDGHRWLVRAEMTLHASETPNPNSRLYTSSRTLSAGRAFFAEAQGGSAWLVRTLLARPDVRTVLVRDATLTVEREPDQPWPTIDQAVAGAIQEHVLRCADPVAARVAREGDGALERAIRAVLEERVLPGIHADGGDMEFLGIEDGVVRVHLIGACRTCPAATLTLHHGVQQVLQDAFPGEIDRVEAV